jgi:hypothetical protein
MSPSRSPALVWGGAGWRARSSSRKSSARRRSAAIDIAQLRALGVAAEIVVGSYVTSLEMAGCSITITLLDAAIAELWNAPVHTAALRW